MQQLSAIQYSQICIKSESQTFFRILYLQTSSQIEISF